MRFLERFHGWLLKASDGYLRGTTIGFLPLLAALAPVVASGFKSLVTHKQQGSAQKQAAEQAKQDALAAEAERRASYEASQNSPGALAGRQKFTLQLGKLLGAAGGKDKVPPSIYNYLNQQRTAQAYTPGAPYQAPVKKGGGFWDFASGLTDALSYLDTEKVKDALKKKPAAPKPQVAFQTGHFSDLLKPKTPGFASGTQNFG